MKFSQYFREMIRDFFIIFASIIIIISVLRLIYMPDASFDLKSIFTIMAFSLLGALSGILLYTPHAISEIRMRIRVVIHFFFLEIVLISLGIIVDVLHSFSSIVLMAVQITLVYAVVRFLSYEKDKQEAKLINERLKVYKNEI